METIRCKACGRELPPEAFRLVRGGGRGSTCRECCKERQLETRHRNADRGGSQSPVTDPDFDGKAPGDVWRQMCRAEKWLESLGYVINLSGEYREVKIRKLKKE